MREFIKARRKGNPPKPFHQVNCKETGEIQKWYFRSFIDLLGEQSPERDN